MSELFDDVTRVVAEPISRRQALKLIAGAVGAVILNRFFGAPRPSKAQDYCDYVIYTHPCADICCRDDYYCASTVLLNGQDDYGICCYTTTGSHLCSAGGYGWCCVSGEDCGTELYSCVCSSGYETCGNVCCDTSAGEICCDPGLDLCCAAGVVCCYDSSDDGTCCPDGTKCVPSSATGYPPGHVCCPDDQACLGQCCPDGELCVFNLACCPADRTPPDRTGCCPSGFKYMPSGGCCLDGLACGDICCTNAGEVCLNGTCQECPGGQSKCFDKCCAPGTCCFGKCCGDGQTCTGECTTLETINEIIDPSNGGTLNSSDGGVTINFIGLGTEETVQYTSQMQSTHPLPQGAQLLRSFKLISPSAGAKPQQVEYVFYTMRVRYTEVTLAAMEVISEFQLRLLWWDPSSLAWIPAFFPEIDRAAEEVIVDQAFLGEFALVAVEETQNWSATYLPLVKK